MGTTMSHAHEPSRFARGFYILSATLMAAVATSVLLQIILSSFSRPPNAQGLIVLFFCLNVVGHKIRNYIWANLLGVSVLIAVQFFSNTTTQHVLSDYATLAFLVLAGIGNAYAMTTLRRFGQPKV